MAWIVGTLLLAAAGGLYKLSMESAEFAEWYRENIYRVLSETVSRISGEVSFSVTEAFAAGILLLFVLRFLGILFRKEHRIRRFFRWLGSLYGTAAFLLFLYVIHCGINYRSVPFSVRTGLYRSVEEVMTESGGYDGNELYELCAYIVEQLQENEAGIMNSAANAEEIRREGLLYGSETEIGENGRKAMENLASEFPDLAGFYPRPKPLFTSEWFSAQQVTGIYLPFFIEAAWNRDIPGYNRPFTVCHELSHLRGFMREDEANFIAFLACIHSERAEFSRSGWLEGWVYAGNALAAENPEAFGALYSAIPDSMKTELSENNEFWDRYRGKAAEVHEKVNDAYLRASGQEEGVKSYGRIVDLMLAYAKKQGWKASAPQ